MVLQQLLLSHLVRPKVVHALPGRLRVHIAALTKLPDGNEHLIDMAESLLAAPECIESARICCRTGNLLLIYRQELTTQSEVMELLSSFTASLAQHATELLVLSRDDLAEHKDQCVAVLQSWDPSQGPWPDMWEVFSHGME